MPRIAALAISALTFLAACSGPIGSPTTLARPTTTIPQTSPVAAAYLDEAIDIMRSNSPLSPTADWEMISEAMTRKAEGATEVSETYEAIELGLRLLDDPRAVFVSPQALAEHEGEAPDIEDSKVEIREDGLGYILSGQFIGDPSSEADGFSASLAKDIVSLDPDVCGWILDLRITRFGIPGPVLAGVAPLLDQGEVGGISKTADRYTPLRNSGSEIFVGDEVIARNSLEIPATGGKPVAVLVGSLTAFPGEVVAIAFQGQENVELFGQPTHGFSYWADLFDLSDGSVMVLSTGELTNRLGERMAGGNPLTPDTVTDNTTMSEQAAVDWLQSHPSCA